MDDNDYLSRKLEIAKTVETFEKLKVATIVDFFLTLVMMFLLFETIERFAPDTKIVKTHDGIRVINKDIGVVDVPIYMTYNKVIEMDDLDLQKKET